MTMREAVEKFLNEKNHMKQIKNPPFDHCNPVKYEGSFSDGCAWYIYDGVGYMCKNEKDRHGIIRKTWFELF